MLKKGRAREPSTLPWKTNPAYSHLQWSEQRPSATSVVCVCVCTHTLIASGNADTWAGHILLDSFPAVLLFHGTPFSKRAGGGTSNSTPLLQCWEIWQMFEEFMCIDLNAADYNQLRCYAESLQHAAGGAAVITAWTNKQKVCVIPEVWLESQAATSQRHFKQTNKQESNPLSHHYSVQFPAVKVHVFSSCFSYCLTAQNNWKSYEYMLCKHQSFSNSLFPKLQSELQLWKVIAWLKPF